MYACKCGTCVVDAVVGAYGLRDGDRGSRLDVVGTLRFKLELVYAAAADAVVGGLACRQARLWGGGQDRKTGGGGWAGLVRLLSDYSGTAALHSNQRHRCATVSRWPLCPTAVNRSATRPSLAHAGPAQSACAAVSPAPATATNPPPAAASPAGAKAMPALPKDIHGGV